MADDRDKGPDAGGQGGGNGARRELSNEDLITQYGSADAALTKLRKDRAKMRRRLETMQNQGRVTIDSAELQSEVHELERVNEDLLKRVPPDGAVVLSAADAKAWEAYRALGKPDEVKTKLEQGEKDASEAATLRDTTQTAEMGAALGWKPDVLRELKQAKGVHLEMREVEVDGTGANAGKKVKAKVPHARPADKADAPLVPLEEYEPLKPYHPALKAEPSDERDRRPSGGGPNYPPQRPTDRQPAPPSEQDLVDKKKSSGLYSGML